MNQCYVYSVKVSDQQKNGCPWARFEYAQGVCIQGRKTHVSGVDDLCLVTLKIVLNSLILRQLSRGSLLIATIFSYTGNECEDYNSFSIDTLTLNK